MDASAAGTESALLSGIVSSTDITNIHHQFTTYLQPFTALQNPKATKKSSKSTTKPPDTSTVTIRSLAKQFLPFLNKTLSLLPKRLSETSSDSKISKQFALILFDIYRLSLNSLDLISSQLSCKPYSVHIQRVRYIHCLEAWELYKEAEKECFLVLESLRMMDGGGAGGRAGKQKMRYVPKVNEKSVDQDLAFLLVEIVVTLVKCASINQSKETDGHERLLVLLHEIGPWFRVLDANAHVKLHRMFVTYLSRFTAYLVEELKHINGEFAFKFCLVTFAEHRKSSLKDQMYKFARRICSHLFTQEDDQKSYTSDILKLVLDTMAAECQVGTENAVVEFLELVSYCANKCRTTGLNICGDVTVYLNKISGDLSKVKGDFSQVSSFIGSVTTIYAAALSISPLCRQSRQGKSLTSSSADNGSAARFFLDRGDIFMVLNDSLLLLKCHFNIGGTDKNLLQDVKSCLVPCFDALKFLCHPLAEFINSEKKEILTELGDSPFYTTVNVIQEAFDQFCSFFLQYHSSAERGRDSYDENDKTILLVAVAALTLSHKTKRKIKESLNFIESIISADGIQSDALKYLFASLYNVAVILYRAKRVEEASKALEIACKASWNCLVLLCQMFGEKSKKSDDALPEAIAGICNEACAKTAFLLDLLHQNSHLEVNRVLRDSLESWSISKSLFEALPSPLALLKQWAKNQCEDLKDVKLDQNAGTVYSMLASSAKVSKWTLGIILEQELLAYREINSRNKKLCQKMRMEIICILLDKLYVGKDSCIQKSRILIAKGSELRANGTANVKECVQCLSEAITILSDIHGEDFSCEANRLLVYAYCLRELCTQETEPNTKVLLHTSLCAEQPVLNSEQQHFRDICAGVSLCLRPRCCNVADRCHVISEGILNLLYHVLDLLSIKGYMDLHSDIYTIMLQLFEWRKIPVGKFLAVLWKSRRLSHALCASPIDALFMKMFSKNGSEFSSVAYWSKCMKEPEHLLVGFQQCLFLMPGVSSQNSDRSISTLQSDVTDKKVKEAASDLISIVPLSSESIFLSAYLYHDLCERLILSGQLIEALVYGKEAHRLRSKLLREKFVYTIEQPDEKYNETGELTQKCYYKLKAFEVNDSVAAEAWYCDGLSFNFEDLILTPWNVLQCYLESTLQVGIIHEMLGNGSEAETLLQWGKSISCQKNLPLFVASFSSILGKMYRKQHLWDMAEKELQSAREMLNENCTIISCLRCKSVMEVNINQGLGDLYRKRSCSSKEGPSIERLSWVLDIYKSALSNLNLDQWENTASTLDAAKTKRVKNCGSRLPNNYATDYQNLEFPSKSGMVKTENECRTLANAKKERKPLKQVQEHNTRRTRSRCHPSQNNNETPLQPSSMDLHSCSYVPSQRGPEAMTKSVSYFLTEISHLCDRMKCWHCLTGDIHHSTSLSKFLYIRWDLVQRRLLLRLLISIGKCLGACGSPHAARGVLLHCVSLLVNRNLCPQHSSNSIPLLFELIGADTRDMLVIERAALLYHICLMSLKSCPCNNTRQLCQELAAIEPPKIVMWLRLAFILSREVPGLFQKISRLLAALYVLSTSVKSLFLSPGKTLSVSHWASFFHQASIGTHLDQELTHRMSGKQKCEVLNDLKHSSVSRLAAVTLGTSNSFSHAPISEQDLEEFVIRFFQSLPSTRVICISFLGGVEASLLSELVGCSSSGKAWLLLSRLNVNSHPVVILLPLQSISREVPNDDKDCPPERTDFSRKWPCPWNSSVVDDVAPVFRIILEENYMSSAVHPLEDSKRSRLSWWKRRKELDNHLADFLRDMEQSWLGPWNYLLSEEWPDFRHLDSLRNKVLDEFSCNYRTDACECSPEDASGDSVCVIEKEDCVLQLILNQGCYVGRNSCEKCKVLSNTSKALAEIKKLVEVECRNQKPVILVMDYDVQMLPWESLPILRNQEVYRMPSVYSISVALERCCQLQEPVGTTSAIFPRIDPLDSYYVLNPSGDLSSTQAEFEEWFKDQRYEGKIGTAPTIEELSEALKNHDLFIYFGHGSGSQYIPRHQIEKLESCAATVLMGCSSGSLTTDGCYAPQGAPLSYLLAGAPVIVANLWEVTDKDIDRFGRTILDAWLAERSAIASMTMSESDVITNKLKTMSIRTRRNRGKGTNPKKASETCDEGVDNECRNHRPKIGAFMGQARQACNLPFLIGASPVCYGVPTGIFKKKDI